MRKLKAECLRFAILAARARFEPERLTPHQGAFLDRIDPSELMIGDHWTLKAYDREYEASKKRWLKWNQ